MGGGEGGNMESATGREMEVVGAILGGSEVRIDSRKSFQMRSTHVRIYQIYHKAPFYPMVCV